MVHSPFADFTSRHSPGDILFRAGDPGTTLFVVQAGVIQLLAGEIGSDILAVMEKGDFFGEMSLLEGSPRPYTAQVVEAAQVIEISPPLFDRMIRSNIELAVRMLRKLSLRLGEAEGRLAAQGRTRRPAVRRSEAATKPSSSERAVPRPGLTVTDGLHSSGGTSRPGPGAASLTDSEGKELFALLGPTTRVGRFDPVTGIRPEVDLTLLDLKRSVSRRHAVLTTDAEGYLLTEEVGALNGTTVNDQPLSPGEPMRLKHGDRVGFGGVVLQFRVSGS